MTDGQLNNLDRQLKELKDPSKPFGGFSIIFSGDFRQLQPGNSTDKTLLYSLQSSRLFENSLNAAMILNNKHRFKDDPKYGKILKRMWFDNLSLNDRKIINSRCININNQQIKIVRIHRITQKQEICMYLSSFLHHIIHAFLGYLAQRA